MADLRRRVLNANGLRMGWVLRSVISGNAKRKINCPGCRFACQNGIFWGRFGGIASGLDWNALDCKELRRNYFEGTGGGPEETPRISGISRMKTEMENAGWGWGVPQMESVEETEDAVGEGANRYTRGRACSPSKWFRQVRAIWGRFAGLTGGMGGFMVGGWRNRRFDDIAWTSWKGHG